MQGKKNTPEEAAAAKARQALLRKEADARKRAEETPEQTELRKAKERERSVRRSAALSSEERQVLNAKQRDYCYKSNHKDVAATRKRSREYASVNRERDRDRIKASQKQTWDRHGRRYAEKRKAKLASDPVEAARVRNERKAWEANNKHKICAYAALARKRNPEKARQIVRDYHIANVEKIRKQRAEHRAGNADRINAKIKEWRVAHPYYVKDRLASDIQFYLAKALRHRLYQALRAKGIRKSAKTLDLLGCTLAEFKVHIETQFYGGMSWDDMNFHLDHIKQVCTFDLTDPEQQKQCFHYTNIRPLTEDDNLRRPKRAA